MCLCGINRRFPKYFTLGNDSVVVSVVNGVPGLFIAFISCSDDGVEYRGWYEVWIDRKRRRVDKRCDTAKKNSLSERINLEIILFIIINKDNYAINHNGTTPNALSDQHDVIVVQFCSYATLTCSNENKNTMSV